eukprot:CAMPEP_0115070788 /NCGR_PEP_ID=MMETSP0227-20121206/13313_1 /TAXON_ID=89957 /ORGANISM="Polarella glacialis, Strain CCMP 1383" /LENGTH=97 /DNA_ID=CAMNT_0002457351 /DNA_START=172 /DNA_END=465 /DNA_ORIENTATION=+
MQFTICIRTLRIPIHLEAVDYLICSHLRQFCCTKLPGILQAEEGELVLRHMAEQRLDNPPNRCSCPGEVHDDNSSNSLRKYTAKRFCQVLERREVRI